MSLAFTGGTIIAATDFSEDARNAVGRAALVASRHGMTMEVLHVVSRSSLDALREWVQPGTAERLVEDARAQLGEATAGAGAPATPRLVIGEAFPDILSGCSRGALLAIGARGLNPLRDAILGTTAERLAGRYEGPILVVRNPALDPYRKVVAGVDLLPGSRFLLEAALRFAPGAALAAAHAYDVPFDGALQRSGITQDTIERYRDNAHQHARSSIRSLAETLTGNAEGIRPVLDRTHPARLIIDSEKSLGADLIVVGKRKRSALESFVLGSVTRHVLADANADVLVVPMPG